MATFTIETIEAQHAAVIRAEVPMQDLTTVFDRGFHETARVAAEQDIAIVGAPFGFYPRMPTDTVEVLVGFPVAAPVTPDGEVTNFELPGGRAATGMHLGSYDDLDQTYEELQGWAATEGIELADQMWESYLSDPETDPDPSTWQTRITWPLARPSFPSANGTEP